MQRGVAHKCRRWAVKRAYQAGGGAEAKKRELLLMMMGWQTRQGRDNREVEGACWAWVQAGGWPTALWTVEFSRKGVEEGEKESGCMLRRRWQQGKENKKRE